MVHWFRLDDNNPIIIDSTPIDGSEYSRDRFQCPTGSTYVANANVGVSNLLGNSQTNTVMATSRVSTSAYFDLTADDVNMVKMSRTGLNRVIGPAGGMNDDHAIQIDIVPCASAHDIKISTAALPSGISGSCSRAIDYVFPADPHTTAQDYKIVSAALVLTNLPGWEFNIPMFYGSFETGTYDAGWVVSP